MRPVYFDQGFRYDDPNIYWGDPSYQLEPGDPGYVPPIPSVNQTKTKRNKMKRNRFYPNRQGDQITWLVNFMNKIVTYGTLLGLSSTQIAEIVADCKWLIYVMQTWLPALRTFAEGATDAVTEAQSGTGTSAQVLPVFTAPALPSGTTAVNPGALDRIFGHIQDFKGNATEAIATDLGIIGSELSGPDLATVQPKLGAKVSGANVDIKWGWGGNGNFLDSCEILVDRGDGQGYRLLTIDTTPNYTDTQAFPAAQAIWSYKAIYRVDDAQVGQWSQTVSVNVG